VSCAGPDAIPQFFYLIAIDALADIEYDKPAIPRFVRKESIFFVGGAT